MRTLVLLLLASLLAVGQNPNTAVFPGSVATDSDLLVASNRASATTSATVAAGDTSISVGSTAAFIVPTVVTFADNGEMAKCLTKTASAFTSCTRGYDSAAGGIAATAHASGVQLLGNATAHYFNQLAVEIKALETAAAGAISNPMTTLGDTLYGGASGAVTRLPGDTSNVRKFLRSLSSGGVAAAPAWDTLQAADVPTLNQSTTGNAATATALASNPTEVGCSATTPTTVTAIDAAANLTCTAIAKAAADGTTVGVAAFAAADFNATLGVISLDYANGQTASGSQNGFLSSTDWTTFNGKQAAGSYLTALTGNVTASGPGSAAATIVSMPTGVTDAGYIAWTAIAAPTTPGAGIGRTYVDSTSKNFAVKDDAGVVKHGVQTSTCTNQFLSAVSDAGGLTCTGATLASAQFANQGTALTLLHGNAAGNPSWSAVDLANDVTGNLGVSHLNGGTSASSSTFWRGDGTWAAAGGGSAPVSNTFANIAATSCSSSNSGQLGLPTDSALMGRCTGSAWTWYLPGFGPVTLPQAAANFTTVNFTGATLTDANGGLFLTAPANGASTNSIRFAYLTAGYPTPSWTKTICFIPNVSGGDFVDFGFAVSDGTKFVSLGIGYNHTTAPASTNGLFSGVASNWTNSTTFSSGTAGSVAQSIVPGQMVCLTLQDDNTNFTLWASPNPFDLQRARLIQVARTNFLTPSRLGIYMNIPQAIQTGSMLILHSTL